MEFDDDINKIYLASMIDFLLLVAVGLLIFRVIWLAFGFLEDLYAIELLKKSTKTEKGISKSVANPPTKTKSSINQTSNSKEKK